MGDFIKEFRDRYLRPTRQFSDIIILSLLISFLVILFGQEIGDKVISVFGDAETLPAALSVFCAYFSFIGIWIVNLLVILVFRKNRPMLKGLGTGISGNNWKGILAGTAIGFCANAFCIFMSILLKDIAISFTPVNPLWMILIFAAVAVQSGAEELVCRHYLYQKLRRRYRSPVIAILVSAVFFASVHLFNPGINPAGLSQIVVIGVLLSILVYYYNSLWAAIFVHTAWNYTQNILFGLPNSGIVARYSLFRLDAASDGFFFNPAFGVEGSWGAVAILAIIDITLFIYARRNKLKPEDIWDETEAESKPQ